MCEAKGECLCSGFAIPECHGPAHTHVDLPQYVDNANILSFFFGFFPPLSSWQIASLSLTRGWILAACCIQTWGKFSDELMK